MNRSFERFARKHRLAPERLIEAVERAQSGLVDARLGSGLIKQRVGREGQGRSGGFRAVIVLEVGKLAVCVHDFAKNDASNLNATELEALRALAKVLLEMGEEQVEAAVARGVLIEV